MFDLDTILGMLNQLHSEGYTEDFRVRDGMFHLMPSSLVVDVRSVVVDDIKRFEGETNLDDEAVIFCLSVPGKNLKGTYVVAFGPMMDHQDSLMVERLPNNSSTAKR